MNISKSSWHYRLLNRLHMLPGLWRERNNTDLCTYMRRLALALFLLALVAFVVLTYPYGWYIALSHVHQSPFQMVIIFFWAMTNGMGITLAAGGLLFLGVRAKEKWDDRHASYEHKLSIFAAYWQQLKDRTCHMVTYGDSP